MRERLRHGLIWMLTVALMAAGMPFAHARDCETSPGKSAGVMAAPMAHHEMHMSAADESIMDHASTSHDDDRPAATPCKCLNCSSLCAAFVAPMPQVTTIHRRAVAIVYHPGETSQKNAAVFIDPGIPIVA